MAEQTIPTRSGVLILYPPNADADIPRLNHRSNCRTLTVERIGRGCKTPTSPLSNRASKDVRAKSARKFFKATETEDLGTQRGQLAGLSIPKVWQYPGRGMGVKAEVEACHVVNDLSKGPPRSF